MIDPKTGEEIVEEEETGEKLTEEEQKVADEAKVAEEVKAAEDAKKAEEEKENSRKAYEQRQQKKGEKPVSRQEFDKLQEEIKQDKEERSEFKFRQAHPDITDEEFNSIKAHSKGSGKSLDDTLKDPDFEEYFETRDAKDRNNRATPPPSTKTKSGGSQPDYENMSSDEFQKKQEEVLRKQRG